MLSRYFLFSILVLSLGLFINAEAQGHRHKNKKNVVSDNELTANYNWEGYYVFHPFGSENDFPSYTLQISKPPKIGYQCRLIYATKDHLEIYSGIGSINNNSFKIFFSDYKYGNEQSIAKSKDMALKFVNGKLRTYGRDLGMNPEGGVLLKKME